MTRNSVQAWVGSASDNHARARALGNATTGWVQWMVNTRGKDHADELLRQAHGKLLEVTTAPPPTLVLLNGDGAPSSAGPKGWNCFVAAAREHIAKGGEVKSIPFDHAHGCSPMWKKSTANPPNQLKPRNATDDSWQSWLNERAAHVDRSEDLLSAVFPADPLKNLAARLGQLYDSWRRVRSAVPCGQSSLILDWCSLPKSRIDLPGGSSTSIPSNVREWAHPYLPPSDRTPWDVFMASTLGALQQADLPPGQGASVGRLLKTIDPGNDWPKCMGLHPVVAAFACLP